MSEMLLPILFDQSGMGAAVEASSLFLETIPNRLQIAFIDTLRLSDVPLFMPLSVI